MSSVLTSGVEIAAILHRAYLRHLGPSSPCAHLGTLPGLVRVGHAVSARMDATFAEMKAGNFVQRMLPLGKQVDKRSIPIELLYWLPLVDLASVADEKKARAMCKDQELLFFKGEAGHLKPGYTVLRDRKKRAIVCIVRGTHSVSDVLTDLTVDAESFLGEYGHKGVISAAMGLGDELGMMGLVKDSIAPGEEFILVGHSLGGAVALAMAMYLRDKGDLPFKISCVAFSPPPFCSPALARQHKDPALKVFIHGTDIVPRISVGSLDRFFTSLEVPPTTDRAIGNALTPLLGRSAAQGIQGQVPVALQTMALPSTNSGAAGQWTALQAVASAVRAAAIAMNLGNQGGPTVGATATRSASPGLGHRYVPELRLPGQLFYLFRTGPGEPAYFLEDVDADSFSDLEITYNMISDHMTNSMGRSLEVFLLQNPGLRCDEFADEGVSFT